MSHIWISYSYTQADEDFVHRLKGDLIQNRFDIINDHRPVKDKLKDPQYILVILSRYYNNCSAHKELADKITNRNDKIIVILVRLISGSQPCGLAFPARYDIDFTVNYNEGLSTLVSVLESDKLRNETIPNTLDSVRNKVFFCYSHQDKKWLNRLQRMMLPGVDNDKILMWSDNDIESGEKWQSKIDEALASTKVAVLMVSPDFLVSEFIKKKELPFLLEAAEKQNVTIMWMLLRYCLYKSYLHSIDKYQAAHDILKPLNSLKGNEAELDKVLVIISEKILAAVTKPSTKTIKSDVHTEEYCQKTLEYSHENEAIAKPSTNQEDPVLRDKKKMLELLQKELVRVTDAIKRVELTMRINDLEEEIRKHDS